MAKRKHYRGAQVKRRRGLKLSRQAVLAAAAAVLTLVVAIVILDMVWGAKLNTTIAAIRLKGEALSPGEFVLKPLPDADNAAVDHVSAYMLMTIGQGGAMFGLAGEGTPNRHFQRLLDFRGIRGADGNRGASAAAADIDRLLADDAVLAVLEIARRAAAKPGCRFNPEVTMRLANPVHPDRAFSNLIGLLCVKIAADAAVGRDSEALATSAMALRLATQLREEPDLRFQRLRLDGYAEVLAAVEPLLRREFVADNPAMNLINSLREIDIRQDIGRALTLERVAMAAAEFEPTLAPGRGERGIFRRLAGILFDPITRPFAKNEYAEFLSIFREAGDLFESPYHRALANSQLQYLEIRLAAVPFHCRRARRLLPDFPGLYRAAADVELAVARALVANALEIHRANHGEYPEELTDLAPTILAEIPDNPITGKPLAYERWLPMGGYELR